MAAGKRCPMQLRAGGWQVVGVGRARLVAIWVMNDGQQAVGRRARLRGAQCNPKVVLGRCARQYLAGTLVVVGHGCSKRNARLGR